MCLAVRNDVLAALGGTDGDYVPLQTTDIGALFTAGDLAEDAAHSTGDYGTFILGVRNDALAALGGTDGDYAPVQLSDIGAVFTAGDLAEDAAHASGDYGRLVLAVRNDVLAALGGADGDNSPLQVSDIGALFTAGDLAEDAAHASGDYGRLILAVRNDVLASLAGADGDNAPLQVDLSGALLTNPGGTSMACVEINITATGTSQQGADLACRHVLVSCQSGNTSNCFVRGTTGNGVTGGLELVKGLRPTRFDVGNTNDLWFDAGTNGDDVRVCCIQG
jgi:hypothetical protein